ncbi:hypothetical protein [Nocardiopsis gilva]|uniref:hypothetical protein n=1 Tax=Nocardiopsis gilva TaxID=280236 RepID=UPI0003494D98|nr:hypothetical protein [Nocardiopsis gilva]
MPLALGMIVLLLVAFFSTIFGLLLAASIGIKRADRGRYHALRDGQDRRMFSGAARSLSGLRFPEKSPDSDTADRTTDSDSDSDSDNGGDGGASNHRKAVA